jgi:hypothetical protein
MIDGPWNVHVPRMWENISFTDSDLALFGFAVFLLVMLAGGRKNRTR